jgi:hypothetical protein
MGNWQPVNEHTPKFIYKIKNENLRWTMGKNENLRWTMGIQSMSMSQK